MQKIKRFFKLFPALVLAVVLLTTAAMAADETFDKENFVGLVLKNTEPSTVTVKLYDGWTDTADALMTPVYTEDGDQYYEVKADTKYMYVAKPTSGYARYNEHRCIYISADDATKKTELDVTPAKRSTSGWDPSKEVRYYTEATLNNIYPSSPDLWPQYAEFFTTPAFTISRTTHKQTTQTEMMNYINGLDSADDKMHVYILGKSEGDRASERLDIPMVLFTATDLSSATTLEEAAALVKANGKLTVHYQAQIHGDEPAGCEAALGMIKRLRGEYGDKLLEKMNIYVIPRLNPTGAYNSLRVAELADGTTTDPNRDFIHLYTASTRARMRAYNLFEPEVVFDNHEYQLDTNYYRVKKLDLQVCCHPIPYFTQEYQDTAYDLAYAAFGQLKADGMGYGWYNESVGGLGGSTGSSNTAMRGTFHILMESGGVNRGLIGYERRVAAHASGVTGILNYLEENAQTVQNIIKEQRSILVEKGKVYDEEDQLIFNYKSVDMPERHLVGQLVNLHLGTVYSSKWDFAAAGPIEFTRTRIAPTAYVIPAGESYTESILELMDKQGISYDFIPAGHSVMLQQYTLVSVNEDDGIITEAGLTDEKSVTFPNGAYAFTMDQVDRDVLAFIMEPDINLGRSQKASLVQQGVITATDDMFPIYRYIRDLNAEGEIDHAVKTFDTENFKGLVLTTTVDGISVKLYDGYADDAALMTPVYTEGRDNYYEVEAGGRYKYVARPASGYGRYHIRKNIYITAEEAATKQVIDVTPHVRTTAGWDTYEPVKYYSDEAMAAAFPSSPDLWPAYKDLFTTPVFTIARNPHKQTTQTEMMNYIDGLNDADDHMYVYVLGKSGGQSASKQFDIPVVFFTETDLSGAESWEEAAQLLKANGKLTFMYQAQIHGKETGGGEAAMAMLKHFDGTYGDGLLDNMNIVVVPRLNPWGACESDRSVYFNGEELDANRDYMKLETAEVQLSVKLYNSLEPELFYDAHECFVHPEYDQVGMHDVYSCVNFVPFTTQEFKSTALTLADKIFARAKENNLTYGWYSDSVNGYNTVMGTTNLHVRGSLVFLNESQGILGGNQQIERRIMSHVSAVTGVLDYVNANVAAVQKVVDDQRADIINRGKTYEASDVIVLETGSTVHPEQNIDGKKVDTGSGAITDTTFTGKTYDVVKKSRVAPTAYVIPAGQSWTENVLALLDKHGITYTQIPAANVQLQQYTGTTSAASLTEEATVAFPAGAYVMTMAQKNAYILGLLMEPDVKDLYSDKGTLAQQGLITATDGAFPIYRYIHDLNADGTITYKTLSEAPAGLTAVSATKIGGNGKIIGLDAATVYEYRAAGAFAYTAVAAGATEIADLPVGTYYVRVAATAGSEASADAVVEIGYGVLDEYVVFLDSTNGVATNDGYTDKTPVNTLELAHSQLTALMESAPAGTTGKIVIVGTYTINNTTNTYQMPTHSYPVLITGGKLIYKDASGNKYLCLGGDTTFDDVTLKVGSASDSYILFAMGHKLVIGENVTTEPYTSGTSKYYFAVAGGNNSTVSKTDMTILSGYWYTVYAGGRNGKVTGDCKLVAKNCSITRATASRACTINGDVYISLENVESRSSLICGNNTSGNVSGNVTMVLGEGVIAPAVYAGSNTAGNVGGIVTIVADGIDLTQIPIYGKAYNADGTVGGLKLVLNKGELADVADTFVTRDGVDIVLGCDQTEAATLNYSCNLDLGGCDATITVADGKTLTVCDTATDDFKVLDAQGYGILSATGNVVAKEGYVVREEEGGKSYHRRELKLDNVVLRPSAAGIYYTGQFGLNELYRGNVESYGVVLSLDPDPALDKDGCAWSVLTAWPETGAGYGTVLQGIMTQNGGYSSNKANAERVVYGVAYIKYTDGTVEYSNYAQCTLRQVVEASDAMWNDLTQPQKEGLLAMYGDFANVMRSWNIPNIQAEA